MRNNTSVCGRKKTLDKSLSGSPSLVVDVLQHCWRSIESGCRPIFAREVHRSGEQATMTRTVLLVDDDDNVLKTISPMLTDAGFKVVAVTEARVGLDELQANAFDLIITDILMPDMEGIEFIMKLRAKSPRVPIIAISGGGRISNASFLTFAQKLGANAVLEKPFGRDQLLDVVTRVLATS